MRGLILVAFILLLSSCSSLGPRYSEVRDEISRVDEGVARIIVLRTDAYFVYWGRSTPIEVNDEDIASCPMGGFVYFDVEPVQFKLSTETWDYAGECGFLITPTSGKTYYFEIRPRDDSLSGLPGTIIPGVIGIAYMAGAMVIDSAGDGCKGMFSLTSLSPDVAKQELLKLRLAE
jgi:hypothetical protein